MPEFHRRDWSAFSADVLEQRRRRTVTSPAEYLHSGGRGVLPEGATLDFTFVGDGITDGAALAIRMPMHAVIT